MVTITPDMKVAQVLDEHPELLDVLVSQSPEFRRLNNPLLRRTLARSVVVGRPLGDRFWVAAGWLALTGWASTAIQGFLYKISTFLMFLHRYAPLVGQRPVPKLDEMYHHRLALIGWGLWVVGVALAAMAVLLNLSPVLQAAILILMAGGLAFLLNMLQVGRHWVRDAC